MGGGNGKHEGLDRPWMKGQMRDAQKASRCAHLQVTNFIEGIEIPTGVMGPGNLPITRTMVVRKPELTLLCTSPELLRAHKAQLPPDVAAQFKDVRVTLEICRLCPWWEEK